MLNENRSSLARYRLAAAKENYEVAELLLNESKYKDAVNRSYYIIVCVYSVVLHMHKI